MVSAYPDLKSPIGHDFGDEQTQAELELMDELHKLGVSKYVNLPQLIVVGDQSVGKSSVLQAVTEIPFPTDDKMCTRFATEIVHKRTSPSDTVSVTVEIIPDSNETQERKELLSSWRPLAFGPTLDKETMNSIFKQAESVIIEDHADVRPGRRPKYNRLSSSVLRITRRGPDEKNFAIVDIPGLVRGDAKNTEHQTAKTLVQHYMHNPRSIIVAVIDVIDLERQEVLHMLDDIEDKESRIVGVINKCDTKQKQSHDWVFELIKNDDQSPRYLKEGWYGLRNRAPIEANISDAERDAIEDAFFSGDEWNRLNKKRLGRHHLRSNLIKMRNRHVKQSIPSLLSEIKAKLALCNNDISKLGPPCDTNFQQFTLINGIATKYSRMTENSLNGNYRGLDKSDMFARKLIRDGLDKFCTTLQAEGPVKPFVTCTAEAKLIPADDGMTWSEKLMKDPTYGWIRQVIESFRGTEFPGDLNPLVVDFLWRKQTTGWRAIAEDALAEAESIVERVNEALFQSVCSDDDLRVKLRDWLHADFQKASVNAAKELERLISDEIEGHLFTLHPHFTALRMHRQQNRINEVTSILAKEKAWMKQEQGGALIPNLSISSDKIVGTELYHDKELAVVLNTHDSLEAYYELARYRFTDNVATQVIERHLLGPDGPLRLFSPQYVSEKLYGEQNEDALSNLVGENPKKAQKRHSLDTERRSLEESMKRLQAFKML
ncbi:uncharacterized protein EAE98_004703 [Botrytis deweyae]|uniref:GED domain-containing protein n=1 Tax=Botrytis deweyae TaxID=2478750 RepID=A0ABQ7IP39_9HELO|nr:uncharacterized protein EAE98_004703 [Botrytis deweyae]KAF7930302.1 hypothetical protein EAE98_004703 [Botrytis deweyae]